MPSYIIVAFLSLDFCQLDLSSLLGPTVFVINNLVFQQLPYLQGFSLALLKVAGQSEPLVLNIENHKMWKRQVLQSAFVREERLLESFFSNFHVALKRIGIWKQNQTITLLKTGKTKFKKLQKLVIAFIKVKFCLPELHRAYKSIGFLSPYICWRISNRASDKWICSS